MPVGAVEAALLVAAVLPAAVAVAFVARLLGRRSDGQRAAAFLQAAGLPGDDPRAAALVAAFLARARQCRFVGILIGAVAGVVLGVPTGAVAGAMAGLMLGSVAAATYPVRSRTGGRVAALAPRQLGDYVPRRHVLAFRLAVLAAAGLAFVASMLPPRPGAAANAGSGTWLAAVAVTALVLLLAEGAARRIVRRRQQASSAVDVQVDDAIRSACARAVVGSGLGLALLTVAVVAWTTADATAAEPLRLLMQASAFAALVAAPVAWAAVAGGRPVTVRRVAPVSSGTAAR